MIHVVVLDRVFAGARRGVGAPAEDVDHAEGVVWRGGAGFLLLLDLAFVERPAAAAKESLVCCGAPGLFAFRAMVRYWLIVSSLRDFLGMSTLNKNLA